MSELNVKAGDKVIVRSRTGIDRIGIVDKVTPTGRITVDGSVYRKDGSQITKDIWFSSRIVECNKEAVEEILHQEIIHKTICLMRVYSESRMTYEKALKILELLEVEDGETSQQASR